MNEPRSHELDIYGVTLHAATDRDQWKAIRRQVTSLHKNPAAGGFASLDTHEPANGLTKPHLTLYVDVKAHQDDTRLLVDTCAHEAAHGACMILDHIGQAYDSSSEAFAYLAGWLTAWLWEACTQDRR